MINRWFYTRLWQFAPPLIRRYLKKRGRKSPAYLENWGERFGEPLPDPVQRPVWIHAVSVGETRAAQPLAEALRRYFPDAPLLLTQMTPTGRAAAQELFPDAQCRYLPYDRPEWVRQFLREHNPLFGVLMETEIWPNLMHGCAEEGVPLFLANARLSEKSARGYRRIDALIRPALQTLAGCLAQTEEDAARLRQLGAANVSVCGNSKYDIAPPEDKIELAAQWRRYLGRRRVLVASTREKDGTDEAHEIVRAWRQHRCADDLLVLVPRHPERFGAAAEYAQSLGLTVQKRSSGEAVAPNTQVWVGDSMGEMFACGRQFGRYGLPEHYRADVVRQACAVRLVGVQFSGSLHGGAGLRCGTADCVCRRVGANGVPLVAKFQRSGGIGATCRAVCGAA
mgnify:CR=1 FL=1